jgi:acyl carrier protein
MFETTLDNKHFMGYKKVRVLVYQHRTEGMRACNAERFSGFCMACCKNLHYALQKGELYMETFEKIRALLAEQLDIEPDKITMESDIMNDFEADSLDIVDMVMTLEDEFGIEVPDEAIENLRTVGDVVQYVDANRE